MEGDREEVMAERKRRRREREREKFNTPILSKNNSHEEECEQKCKSQTL